MSLKVFHQNGHNANWNRDALEKGIGTGCIFSPVHEPSDKVKNYKKSIKESSIFDPQFYLPSSQKPKFKSYDFFPNTIMGETGYSTLDYSSVAIESARRCIKFQLDNNFKAIVIPTRFFEQMVPKYIENQTELFVSPFLKSISESKIRGKKVYLTVPVTSHMLNAKSYKDNILNWLTNYPEIDGVYFICQFDRKTKQVQDTEFLLNYMDVIKSTNDADLDVIVGYSNTESILYSLCGEVSISIGAFENTRIFTLDKFVVSDEIQRGPKPRLYIPKLLNWIHLEQAKLLRNFSPEIWNKVYTETEFSKAAMEATKEPAFNSPLLYKHYFSAFESQIKELSNLTISERYQKISSWIQMAKINHADIKENALELDPHGNGDHLLSWENTIQIFKKQNS
jgi:hypothetical protein